MTVNNTSSVGYDIINGDENKLSGFKKIKIFEKKITNKKKGVTEFADLTRYYTPNFIENFKKYTDNKIFYKYNGIFSYMYNVSHRNGNLAVPFKDKKLELEKVDGSSMKRLNTASNIHKSSSSRILHSLNSINNNYNNENITLTERLNKPFRAKGKN